MTMIPIGPGSAVIPIRVPVTDQLDLGTEVVAWLRRHRLDLLLLVGLVALTGVAHLVGMGANPARGDDEGTYVSQAWAIQQGELAHYTYWYDHPPLGWIQLAAYDQVTGAFDDADSSVAGGRQTMLVVKVASVVALYALARRLRFSPATAALAVALFALGPLAITFQRAVWLDNLAVLWLLAALALAAEARGRMGLVVLGAVCFAIAVLTKETTLLVAPFLGWLTWRTYPAATRLMALVVAITTSAMIVVGYPLLATLRGELFPGDDHVSLFGAVGWQLFSREGSGEVWRAGTEANGVVGDWFAADPQFLAVGVVAAVPALFVPRLRPLAACLVFHLVLMLRGGYLPVPYIIVLIPLLALCVAGVIDALAGRVDGETLREVGRWLRYRVAGITSVEAPRITGEHRMQLLAVGSLAVVGATLALGIAPHWLDVHRQGDLRSAVADSGTAGAESWLVANVDRNDTLVVEDTIWLDMVQAGFERDNVIWFFKVDLDPGVDANPASVDYVALHTYMAEEARPRLAAIIDASEEVATFGEGIDEVTIWRVRR